MQMYLLVRGAQDRVNRWINDLHAQNYKWKGPNGKEQNVRLMIRPVQMIELAFPEDSYNEVLSTVMPYDHYGYYKAYNFMLRKLLGLKPIQQLVMPNFKVDNTFVQKIGIGVKKDPFHPDGWEML